ncbi:MAG: hypothetical protein IJQ60_08795 [Prevotella sp.]|nr:hypothetical protein [Prevotella sp.]MBR0263967.1 hypothetical protein [Prevotella sp.]
MNIINRTVATGSSRTLNHLHDIKALLYLTEYALQLYLFFTSSKKFMSFPFEAKTA